MTTQNAISDIYKEYDINDFLDNCESDVPALAIGIEFDLSLSDAFSIMKYHEQIKAAEAKESEPEPDPDAKYDEMMQQIADDNL